MMLRIQAERLAGLHLDLEDYKSRYQANAPRMATYAPKALLMHPGPIIRGLELTSEVSRRAAIGHRRAGESHGVAIRMALLARALLDTPAAAPKSGDASRQARQESEARMERYSDSAE